MPEMTSCELCRVAVGTGIAGKYRGGKGRYGSQVGTQVHTSENVCIGAIELLKSRKERGRDKSNAA